MLRKQQKKICINFVLTVPRSVTNTRQGATEGLHRATEAGWGDNITLPVLCSPVLYLRCYLFHVGFNVREEVVTLVEVRILSMHVRQYLRTQNITQYNIPLFRPSRYANCLYSCNMATFHMFWFVISD